MTSSLDDNFLFPMAPEGTRKKKKGTINFGVGPISIDRSLLFFLFLSLALFVTQLWTKRLIGEREREALVLYLKLTEKKRVVRLSLPFSVPTFSEQKGFSRVI